MLITAQTLKKRPPIRATPPAQRALITAQMQREGSSCKSPHRGQHHSAPQRTHRVDNQPLKGKPAVRVTGSPQTAPPTDRLAHTVLPTAYPTAHRLANHLSHGTSARSTHAPPSREEMERGGKARKPANMCARGVAQRMRGEGGGGCGRARAIAVTCKRAHRARENSARTGL